MRIENDYDYNLQLQTMVLNPTCEVRVQVRVQALTCTRRCAPVLTCTSGLSIVRSQALLNKQIF